VNELVQMATVAARAVAETGAAAVAQREAGWGEILRVTPLEVAAPARFWLLRCRRQSGLLVAAFRGGEVHQALVAEGRRPLVARYRYGAGQVSVFAVPEEETAEVQVAAPPLTESLTLYHLYLLADRDDGRAAVAAHLLEPANAGVLAALIAQEQAQAHRVALARWAARGQVA